MRILKAASVPVNPFNCKELLSPGRRSAKMRRELLCQYRER